MVTIEIALGNPDSPEYNAAEQLREMFERDLSPTENGHITIVPNVFLWGEKTRQLDLVVLAQFDQGFHRRVVCKADNDGAFEPAQLRNVYLKNFCWIVEVKDHERVKYQGGVLLVPYKNGWHDATDQSDKQLQSLRNFLREHARIQPYLCNLIWLRNFDRQKLDDLTQGPSNLVGARPTLEAFLAAAFVVNPPRFVQSKTGHGYTLSACAKELDEAAFADFAQLRRVFAEARDALGQLSRDKLEQVTHKLILQGQQYAEAIGQKLVVLRGRAGTGKTIKLLRIAYDLFLRRNQRCLVLTYNKALASDIRRLIALAQIPDDIAAPTMDVRTVHSFLWHVMDGLGVLGNVKQAALREFETALRDSSTLSDDDRATRREQFEERFFLSHYDALKHEVLSYLREGAITLDDVASLMTRHQNELSWDTLLIDEAQDWPADEREILFALFSPNCFVVADGIDQWVRPQQNTPYADWSKGDFVHKPIFTERRSLRQKNRLCDFVAHYAQAAGVPWDVQAQDELSGGQVIVVPRGYSPELHTTLMQELTASKNKPYEMMFLVPPDLVNRELRRFALQEQWARWGIALWDGTSPDLRNEYPTKIEEHRLLQYDSCRGLEAWTTVCLDFDVFVEYKRVEATRHLAQAKPGEQLALRSDDEASRLLAQRWAMIPLTRAIDTIVMTLRDSKSETGKLLRSLHEQMPDFVTWLN